MEADQALIKEVLGGNKAAFSGLVSRHQKVLLRLALRMTRDLEMAEDIVQDSFIKAFQKLHTFAGRSSFKSWLFQITVNTTKNKLRKNRPEILDIDKVHVAHERTAEQKMQKQDLQLILREQVDKLPSRQRLALTLRIFEDMSFREIAQIMDCPYDTAKANYRHALMRLRHSFHGKVGHLASIELSDLNDFGTPSRWAEVKG